MGKLTSVWMQLLVLGLAGPVLASAAADEPAPPRIGGTLTWLMGHPEVRAAAAKHSDDPFVPVLVRFAGPPPAARLLALEEQGLIEWRRSNGRILGATTVFLGRVVPAALERLAAQPDMVRIEADWGPSSQPPLDVTVPLSTVDQVWTGVDDHGLPLTGAGVLIADLDTGVDVDHPTFFRRQAAPIPWTDGDGFGLAGTGGEWADADGDGQRDPGETLRWIETQISDSYPTPNPPGFTPGLDWIFIDVDGDGQRDNAPNEGWGEDSPSYGEPILVPQDSNDNGRIEAGEPLYPLASSKVAAIRDTGGRVFRRGTDLLEAPHDYFGHGTPVCGIVAGGEPGFVRLAGIAPDAELMMGVIQYQAEPRYYRDLPEMAAWAAAEGAQILLVEDGEWVWEFMDGSSNGEVLLTELAHDQGIVVVTAAGNLAGGGQHHRDTIRTAGQAIFNLAVPANEGVRFLWINFNWRGAADDLDWRLDGPIGSYGAAGTSPDPAAKTTAAVEHWYDSSPAGTQMLALRIGDSGGLPAGDYVFTLSNHGAQPLLVDAFSVDDRSGWTGVSQWHNANDDGTVTWPGAAHGIIVVAAYSGRAGTDTPQGQLNDFSGRGTALDGRRLVDLAAPGSRTYSTAATVSSGFGSWRRFGGTSAALPHVAGTCALLLQAVPDAHPRQIEQALMEGALADAYTGEVPNTSWGYGKLDAAAALERLRAITGPPAVRAGGGPRLRPGG